MVWPYEWKDITCYHGKKFNKVSSVGKDLSPVTHFALDPKGQIWFSTYGEGLFSVRYP